MPEPMPRRHPQFEADGAPADTDATRRSNRPIIDDPLEELARILGETGGYPARPETTVDVGRRANPARPMPQQLSALEAELFDELRASVTPDTRVRGDFEREITPPIPQRPVDDRDIASLRIAPAPAAAEPEPPRSAEGAEAQWSDFYAYDDGVAAGSYDPAFAVEPARRPAAEMPAGEAQLRALRGEPAYPHATFDEFGREEIAEAAREASPYVSADARIQPHSREEERAAARLPHEESGRGMKIAVAAIAVMLAGGGALAAWKFTGGASSGDPVLVRADGKPMKTLPDPSKAPVADAGPSLAPDDPKAASRIVSKQEDPVDQVSGRTPEGKEVRLINPGAQRPSSDTPHTVKTVVVRPDGSIVSDGTTVRAARTATPPAAPPAAETAPQAPAPVVEAQPAAPQAPPPIEAKPVPTAAVKPTAQKPAATPPTAAPPAPVATVPQAPATPQVKTVAVTPITAPKPTAPTAPVAPKTTAATPPPAGGTGAPMSLGPVGPKLASTPPPAAPVAPTVQPKPAAPIAAAPVAITPPPGGGGDFMVQLSASGSEAEARNSFAAASRKYSALSGRSVDIQRADLGAKGVFYRARVPAGSREQAAALCQQVQSQGGQCMVVKR